MDELMFQLINKSLNLDYLNLYSVVYCNESMNVFRGFWFFCLFREVLINACIIAGSAFRPNKSTSALGILLSSYDHI